LELESTCSSLIWGSVPSNNKSVQTFTLRNRGSHKERLLLSIKDNKNCFKVNNCIFINILLLIILILLLCFLISKFISSGENQVSEIKLLLEPMESQKLNVALISTSNEGQAYGDIVIIRQHSSEKRVVSKIKLYSKTRLSQFPAEYAHFYESLDLDKNQHVINSLKYAPCYQISRSCQ